MRGNVCCYFAKYRAKIITGPMQISLTDAAMRPIPRTQ